MTLKAKSTSARQAAWPAPRRSITLGGFLGAGAIALAAPAVGHAATSPEASCADLAKLAVPDATFTATEVVAAGTYKMPASPLGRLSTASGMNVAGHITEAANPAFCRIAATLKPSGDSNIKVEVWLPLNGWNGKYLGVGNFGWAGSFMLSGMVTGLGEGYAVASTDTGHDSSTPEGQGGRFSLGHPEKMIDYAYRADHLMTVDAKAVIKAFYGKGPAKSYWIGCSLGGLEGLIEAKRYPADYDGIVAGAPPNPIVNFNAEQLWAGWLTNRNPSLQISKEKFTLLHKAVLAACGTPEVGQKQGFVEQPDKCAFTPQQLLCKGADAADCLTQTQIDTIDKIYQGPISPTTGKVVFPGLAKGNEDSMEANGKPFSVALDMFQYFAFQDPNWNWTTLDYGKDVDRAVVKVGPLMHVDADLKPFFARGGKLLMYIGWNDGHNPEELIGYYKRVITTAGPQTRASARLFTIPGMNHCLGGVGCDTFNKLGVIDQWVTQGHAPERIVASKVENGQVVRTRPICAYPQIAKYKGDGDISDAMNFVCAKS